MYELEQKLIGLLSIILNCGYADIEFLIELCDNLKIDVLDVWNRNKEYGNDTDINSLIYVAYYEAIYKAYSEICFNDFEYDKYNILEKNVEIYCNAIDSSCQVIDDGDYKMITNYDESVEAFTEIKNKIDKGLW
jgi:hypothetical protein